MDLGALLARIEVSPWTQAWIDKRIETEKLTVQAVVAPAIAAEAYPETNMPMRASAITQPHMSAIKPDMRGFRKMPRESAGEIEPLVSATHGGLLFLVRITSTHYAAEKRLG